MAVSEVALEYNLKNVYYFGSYASGTQTEESDVDFLVDFGDQCVTLLTIAGLMNELEEKLGKSVDIVMLPLKERSHLVLEKVVKCYAG